MSETDRHHAPTIAPRPPEVVMRLARLGSFHQCRLSFMRVLLRRMTAEGWQFERPVFDIDADGVGTAVYTAHGPERAYSLIAFGHDLPDAMRTDRVIATAWDTTFTLFDGVPDAEDIARLRTSVPLQEAGRVSCKELTLARANRSVRLFDHVVECLAAGRQPERDTVDAVGYVMRTTAVYGSGKFGAADRERVAERPECAPPFQVEMLTVYLIRTFVMDLVERMAEARAPEHAVRLDPALRRRFGIGNSTGLGMAPFLLTHPRLLNNWIAAREWALARVRSVVRASREEIGHFRAIITRAALVVADWHTDHPGQKARLVDLSADLGRLEAHLADADLTSDRPWDRLWRWAEGALSLEGQEMLVSALMEPYPALVDGLAHCMSADESEVPRIDGAMTAGTLRAMIERDYAWALAIDWESRAAQARVWYVSEEKLEPRLGERYEEHLEPWEQPLGPGRDVARLHAALNEVASDTPIAELLLAAPEHRHTVRRVQLVGRHPYAEIRDNTIDAQMLPIDLLRAKLAFFGAGQFDPRSDRWVRINMFRGAPFPHELGGAVPDDWSWPTASPRLA
jgi:hypothetical protein